MSYHRFIIKIPRLQERLMARRDSPLDYLVAFAICFVAGSVSTMVANAYARHVAREARR